MAIPLTRTYTNFTGVDFINESSNVSIARSPDALNVWKDYTKEDVCIETRPGYRLITTIGEEVDEVFTGTKINGIYMWSGSVALVHSENKLYKWSNFPNEPTEETLTTLFSTMNVNNRTSFTRFSDVKTKVDYLYLLDGTNYLRFDGTNLTQVSDNSFIPTTSIGRAPSGGGERYQDVNVLTPKRINSFLADGTATAYHLDAEDIDSVDEVKVNGNVMTSGYTVNTQTGIVTFSTAPTAPSVSGQDNVLITYSKANTDHTTRISKCTKAVIFDDRLFFMGNPDFPNAIFHSELKNPAYISDLNYYEDGTSDSAIKDIVVGNDVLWAFKNKNQSDGNVFYHTKGFDEEQGAVYPCVQGNVETGCYAKAINFQDDIVYLSKSGLEGIISTELESRQIISHRSSLVDAKMVNISDYADAQMCIWNGYLMILVDDKVFLADSRQKYADGNAFQYEWFFWHLPCNPRVIHEYEGSLYIGAEDGKIYVLEGTNDNGEIIESYWTTPLDNFGYVNRLKTTNKRGAIAKIRLTQNGEVNIARKTNKESDYIFTKKQYLTGFSFNNINFNEFRFTSVNQNYIVFKIKEKKFNEISIKVFSNKLNKPIALYSITIEAFVGGYIRR